MFKKILNIIIAILLVSSTSGITVYKHYCGSKLLKQSIVIAPKSCCKGTCNKCHNVVKQIKVNDNYVSQQLSLLSENLKVKTLFPNLYLPIGITNSIFNISYVANHLNFNTYISYYQPKACPLSLNGALRL